MENIEPVTIFSVEGKKKKKKDNNSFFLWKAGLSLLRRRSDEEKQKSKQSQSDVVSQTVVLNQILGSIRPLHIPDNLSSPNCSSPSLSNHSFSSSSPGDCSTTYGSVANLQDIDGGGGGGELSDTLPRHRLTHASPFASAMNLLELGSDGESDDEEMESYEEAENHNGDEMIDRKADEFIANFYSKIRVHERRRSKKGHT